MPGWRSEHVDNLLPGVDQPDLLGAGAKVVAQLALHLSLGVAFAKNFDRQIGKQIRDRLFRNLSIGKLLVENK
mgnify:CR=1 FL=1